jgi:hypothetical protein
MNITENNQVAFEAWAEKRGLDLNRDHRGGGYHTARTHTAWEAWHEACAYASNSGGETPIIQAPPQTLAEELSAILNRHSAACLQSFDMAIRGREVWYGRNPDRGPAGLLTGATLKLNDTPVSRLD